MPLLWKILISSFLKRKWRRRWEGGSRRLFYWITLHKLMWGDNLPHCAWVLCCRQCLGIGSCLEVSISVSTGCRACQIIIDASLESISYSTNKADVSGICTYQSDKTWSRGKPWGVTFTGEKCTQDDRWTWGERVLSSKKIPHRCWESLWAKKSWQVESKVRKLKLH